MKKETKAGKPLDVEQVKVIFKMLSKGKSKSSIAKELGIHVRTVIRWSQLEEEEAIKRAMKLRERTTDYQIPREEIENEPIVKDWLSTYSGRGGENRATAILYFCNLVEKKPKELIEEAEQEIREGKLLRERGYFKYFQNFEQMLQAKEYAPHTIKALVYGVKAFYQYFQISELPKELRRKTNHVEGLEGNEEAKLTKSDIKDMLSACRYLRDRAIILTLSSSGLGGAEARDLTLGNFFKGYDAETGICELSITREKTLYRFTTYLSPEASQMIIDYLKIERGMSEDDFEKYLTLAKEKKNEEMEKPLFTALRREDGKRKEGKRATEKELTKSAWIRIFLGIAQRLGKYELNGNKQVIYHKYHAHLLRKFFNTQMKEAGTPDMAVEVMLAHKSQTREAYFKSTQLKEIYMKFMPSVIIHPTETHVLESEDYKELKEENEALKAAFKERNGEVANLKDRITEMEAREEVRNMRDEKIRGIDTDITPLLENPNVQAAIIEALRDNPKIMGSLLRKGKQ